MEKPYIEYQGNKYEFEASFGLKREYENAIKAKYSQLYANDKFDEKELNEMKKFVEENKELKNEDLKENKEIKVKLSIYFNYIAQINPFDVQYEYCFKMLNKKYGIDKEYFDEMLNSYAEDFGMDFIDELIGKVCEKVFTQVGVKNTQAKEKKARPSWMN